ncbi:MAG: hypothetical protein ACYTG2_18950 [Planctomycetota bacterium]|jgi:hypothetical protein
MTDPQTEHDWERQRACVAVPDGFADRVMDALPARGAAAPPRARFATPFLRAAMVLIAAGACLFRVYHALRLFSP